MKFMVDFIKINAANDVGAITDGIADRLAIAAKM